MHLLSVCSVLILGQIIKLLLRFVPYLKGYLLLQINPKYAYDTNKIVATAERKRPFPANLPYP